MAGKVSLSRAAVKGIQAAVDQVFHKVSARYLGPDYLAKLGNKQIAVSYRPGLTLPELYASSSHEERSKPSPDVMEHLARIAQGYLDATREHTKANVVAHVDRFLRDAEDKDVDTNLEKVLGGVLTDVFAKAKSDVVRIVDTENTHARNLGTLEGVTKINAALGVEDPVVYFITAKDDDVCAECIRLHTLGDAAQTPRVWLLSEVSSGLHHRGESTPKIGGLHPHCRCSMATLLIGYGFKSGLVSFISMDHNELEKQRG